jgi:predicted transcriptional regulator of viral defense system
MHRNDLKLIEYLSLMKNKSINKRLGFLIESLKIDAKELISYCKNNISSGYSKLDPTIDFGGSYVRRWNLRLNVSIDEAEFK